ncbi:MAG: peptide MFS transporter, partial [Candidatus Eisenbacteria bacterium]
GQRKAVVLGGILMAIGHFLMAVQSLFFPALVFLILGNGAFKPNISTQVGRLYPPGDPRRDGAFTIFYMGINLGAFFSPLVCGTLGQKVGWHWGFAAAGVGMVLGLCLYLFGRRYLVIEEASDDRPPLTPARATAGIAGYIAGMIAFVAAFMSLFLMPAGLRIALAAVVAAVLIAWLSRLPRDERPRVITLFVLCALNVVFWAVYEQQGNTMQLWADRNTNWNLMGFMVPSTWYQAFNPFMIFVFAPLLSGFWAWQAQRRQEPSSVVKMAMGCFLLGLSFLIMIAASQGMALDAKRSVMWLVGSTLVITIGELYLSPIGLSFVTKIAPVRMVSMLMGVWFLANFAGNYLSGYIGTFYEKMSRGSFFVVLAVMGVGAGLVMFLISRPLDKAVAAHDRPGS